MATAMNPVTGEITIQQNDMTLLQASPEIRGLDVDALRLELRDLEENEANRWATKTHNHTTTLTLVGTIYQRKLEFLEPYFFTFTGSGYKVQMSNGDNNIDERTPGTNVSLRTANSAGSTLVESGTSGLTSEESTWLSSVPNIEVDIDFLKASLRGEKVLEKVTDTWYLVIYNTDSPRAEITRKALKDANGNEIDDLAAGALAKELESSV